MSKSAIPTRTILPKGEEMMCPDTVQQSLVSLVHPLAGPALVSPDSSRGNSKHNFALPESPTLPTISIRPQDNAATTLAVTEGLISSDIQILAPRSVLKPKPTSGGPLPTLPQIGSAPTTSHGGVRLNKFVRRLHDMLVAEKESGVVEWRRGLLVLHSTDDFAKMILPKYFNTRNFKTFRRQLNYYGFVHVRSFSTTGSTTTALWVNRDLAKRGSEDISSVLMLKRVEPCESAKTAEGRRVRKEMAIFTVEEDIGVSPKTLQMEQIRSLATRTGVDDIIITDVSLLPRPTQRASRECLPPPVPTEVTCHHTTALPALPSLSGFSAVVSSSGSSRLAPSPSQMSYVSYSDSPTHVLPGDLEDNVGAANLLLMLSKGSSRSRSSSSHSEDTPSAISNVGYFFM